jgi:hypothetical protein
MSIWSPPTSNPKVLRCSAIERGAYPWRNQMLQRASEIMKGIDGFGQYYNRPLPDPHGWNNRKYLGIRDHAFSLGIENQRVPDYITEKLNDIILNEAVPVYCGAQNVSEYFVPESVVSFEDVSSIDWDQWLMEYEKRRRYILYQKEQLRTRFNLFRYFIRLAEKQSLLSEQRPITLVRG